MLSRWVVARLANQRALTALHLGQSADVCLGIAAMMLLAVQYVVAGRMTLGDLVLVNAYIVQVCMPLNALGFVFRETNDALVNVERMFTVLAGDSLQSGEAGADEDRDRDEPGAKPLIVSAGEIAFEHIDFGYDPARHGAASCRHEEGRVRMSQRAANPVPACMRYHRSFGTTGCDA